MFNQLVLPFVQQDLSPLLRSNTPTHDPQRGRCKMASEAKSPCRAASPPLSAGNIAGPRFGPRVTPWGKSIICFQGSLKKGVCFVVGSPNMGGVPCVVSLGHQPKRGTDPDVCLFVCVCIFREPGLGCFEGTPKGTPPLLGSHKICCWETFYIFAYCGLVGNPHFTAKI